MRPAKKAVVIALLTAANACSSELEGPAPSFASQSGSPIEPAIVCGDQLTTTLDLRGQRFAAVPTDVPSGPALALPSLRLTRSAQLDGSSATPTSVLYGGEPGTTNASALHFIDTKHLRFDVDQARSIEGRTGRIPAGIYDALVTNPSGEQATSQRALAVIDRPTLTESAGAVLCATKAAAQLTLVGSGFVRIGGELPDVSVDAVDGTAASMRVDELAQCTPLALEGLDAQLCTQAKVTLAVRDQRTGSYRVTLTNAAPAACHSEETAQVSVVPAPTLDSSPVEATCTEQKTRALSIRGEGFLEIAGQPPTVMIGGQTVEVLALDSCKDLEVGGRAVRSCQELQVTLPDLALGEGELTIQVDNPEPAHCSVSGRSEQLRNILRSGSSGSRCN